MFITNILCITIDSISIISSKYVLLNLVTDKIYLKKTLEANCILDIS